MASIFVSFLHTQFKFNNIKKKDSKMNFILVSLVSFIGIFGLTAAQTTAQPPSKYLLLIK